MEFVDENGVTQTSGGSGAVFTISNNPGSVDETTFSFNTRGSGYAVGNILTLPVPYSFTATIDEEEGSPVTQIDISATVAANLVVNSTIVASGTGSLAVGTTISNIEFDEENNQWQLNVDQTLLLLVLLPLQQLHYMELQSTPFNYEITALGSIDSVVISNGGVGYFEGDTLGLNPADLVQDIVYTVTSIEGAKLSFTATF